MKQYNVKLEDLIDDWRAQTKWGDQQTKTTYLNKMRELQHDQKIDGFRVQAYIEEDGNYDYYLKIV